MRPPPIRIPGQKKPSLNLEVLVDILLRLEGRLGDIYLECKNNDICDKLQKERALLITMVSNIQGLILS